MEAEYTDYFTNLGDAGTTGYKFFELFTVNLGTNNEQGAPFLAFGKQCFATNVTVEQLQDLKNYLKVQRSWLKKEKSAVSETEVRRRMWFFVQKLVEWGAFDRSQRREIIHWMDVCMDRTLEGKVWRVEHQSGKPAFVITNDKMMEDKLVTPTQKVNDGYGFFI